MTTKVCDDDDDEDDDDDDTFKIIRVLKQNHGA
jgi:hypothetical protein